MGRAGMKQCRLCDRPYEVWTPERGALCRTHTTQAEMPREESKE